MKSLSTLLVAAGFAVATMALAGCASTPNTSPSGPNSSMSGGNGAFGESPAYPGAYTHDHQSKPATTQPASYD
jgi:Spy/CpxP family protein refolding chaperone